MCQHNHPTRLLPIPSSTSLPFPPTKPSPRTASSAPLSSQHCVSVEAEEECNRGHTTSWLQTSCIHPLHSAVSRFHASRKVTSEAVNYCHHVGIRQTSLMPLMHFFSLLLLLPPVPLTHTFIPSSSFTPANSSPILTFSPLLFPPLQCPLQRDTPFIIPPLLPVAPVCSSFD